MVWYFCDPLGNQQADGSGLFLDVIDGFEVLINIAPLELMTLPRYHLNINPCVARSEPKSKIHALSRYQ
jgi:hypothetical protein